MSVQAVFFEIGIILWKHKSAGLKQKGQFYFARVRLGSFGVNKPQAIDVISVLIGVSRELFLLYFGSLRCGFS